MPKSIGLSFPRILLSEWTKLRTLRSTRYSLLAAIVLTIGIAVLGGALTASHWSHMQPDERARFDPLALSFFGTIFGQLALGALGVMVMTGEYSTGMIRSTFAAVPKRVPVLWAKALVFGLTTLVLMLPTMFIAFITAQALLGKHSIALAHHGVLRSVIGAALYMTVVGIFALGLGTIIRNTAGSITAIAAILFVIPPLMNILPSNWNDAISPYLPSNAGRAVMLIHRSSTDLAPWTGFGIFVLYALGALVIASILLKKRDV